MKCSIQNSNKTNKNFEMNTRNLGIRQETPLQIYKKENAEKQITK